MSSCCIISLTKILWNVTISTCELFDVGVLFTGLTLDSLHGSLECGNWLKYTPYTRDEPDDTDDGQENKAKDGNCQQYWQQEYL